jgi:segregation and condensation protein B
MPYLLQPMNEALQNQIEGLLFVLGRPVSYVELAKMLGASVEAVAEAIVLIRDSSQNQHRGVVLVDDGRNVELRASQDAAAVIERIRRDEYSRDIGKAGLETLATVMYRGPLSRSEIDFIRGVNSSQTLRTLLMRGLVRRIPNPRDERSFLYEATTELLAQLGISDLRDLPDYAEVKEKLTALEESYRNANV